MTSVDANAPFGSEQDTFAGEGTGSRLAGEIAAGGTLPRAPGVKRPGLWRSGCLVVASVGLFLLRPIVLNPFGLSYRLPLFAVLPPMLATFVTILLLDRGFSLRRELGRGVRLRTLLSILATFAVAGGAIAYAVSELMPRHFLNMMMERRDVWERIMLLYPFLSVVPQEIAYRTFFFHRYGPLFRDNRVALIVINGLLFGFGHVLFANWLAVAGTFVTGMLFAWRYHASRSFWAVWIEHTLWGWLVFTVGLGGFFFTGVANLR